MAINKDLADLNNYPFRKFKAKTTETTGGLFDAQPSQVTGNIKCTTNPQELVFGFFNAGVPQEKRVFLSLGLGLYSQCAPFDTVSRADAIKGQYFLLSQYFVVVISF